MKRKKGKKIKATLMAVVAVLGLIAFISPVSAYSITNGAVSYDAGNDETTWTFDVTCDTNDLHDISHFTVAWCSEGDVKKVWVNGGELIRDGSPNGWDYGDFDGVHGIKIDYQVDKGATANVEIILLGQYGSASVDYGIKAAGPTFLVHDGTVFGPSHEVSIPEFATRAIPMAIAILGGLFFLNHRKRREE